MPQRWPGSMPGELPAESEVREVFDLGISMLPEEDSEARVRLLGIRAGWSFAYPDFDATEDELLASEAAGHEAAAMALRLGEPNLASAVLDTANASWVSRGWYGRAFPLWEERAAIIPLVTDLLEIGDHYSMGGWMWYELAKLPIGPRDGGRGPEAGRGARTERRAPQPVVACGDPVSTRRLGRGPDRVRSDRCDARRGSPREPPVLRRTRVRARRHDPRGSG